MKSEFGSRHHPTRRRRISWITAQVLLVAVLQLSSCGLPSTLGVIYPPQLPSGSFSADNLNYFQFVNTPQTITAQSYGFELYYKIYDLNYVGSGGYLADVNKMNTAFSSLTPPQDVESYLTSQLQFNRVVQSSVSGYTIYGTPLTTLQYSTLQAIPLVPIDPTQMGAAFTATIDFGTANTSSSPTDIFPSVALNPPIVGASPTVSIARLLKDPASPGDYMLRGFGAGDFYAGDPDLPSSIPPTPGTNVNIQIGMIAVAFANDLINAKQYYSTPLPLTTISYSYVVLATP